MNKLITTNNGGFSLVLDDFRFEQQAVRDAYYGLLSAFGVAASDSFIISGCTLSGGSYQPGYISLFGEVLKFDGQANIAVPVGETLVWDVSITYDSAGDKVFENGSTVQTYQVRKAYITSVPNANAANYLTVGGATTLENKIISMLAGEDWIEVPSSTAKYRKDRLGFVHLAGMIGYNNITTFTLPVGYRPAINQTFRVFWIDNPTSSYTDLTISTAGVVTAAIFNGAGTDKEVSISGISFKHS